MSNMINDLKFEEMIRNFSPPEQFLARQIREVKKECEARKVCSVPQFTRKQLAVGIGGIGGIATLVSVLSQVILQLIEK